MGVKIGRNGKAVHIEGPGEGGDATLCGMGADWIEGTDAPEDCKKCLAKAAKLRVEAEMAQEAEASVERNRRIVARATAETLDVQTVELAAEEAPVALSTWGADGTGYVDQEGHRHLWHGWTDETLTMRVFESIAEGILFTGTWLGDGKIHRGGRFTTCDVCGKTATLHVLYNDGREGYLCEDVVSECRADMSDDLFFVDTIDDRGEWGFYRRELAAKLAQEAREALCGDSGKLAKDGRAYCTCGSIANPAGFCSETGVKISEEGARFRAVITHNCGTCGPRTAAQCGWCYQVCQHPTESKRFKYTASERVVWCDGCGEELVRERYAARFTTYGRKRKGSKIDRCRSNSRIGRGVRAA